MSAAADRAPILVYDGDCGFCARSVRFVLRHDHRRRTVRFAARDGIAGRAVRERHAEVRSVDSLLWVEHVGGEERVLARSDAVLAVAAYLGGVWGVLGGLARLVPRPLRDAGYGVIARVRRWLAGEVSSCPAFPEDARSRALD